MADSDIQPLCEVCGHGVEELRFWLDRKRDRYVYEARCHGAVEQTELMPDVAFRQKPLSHQAATDPAPLSK